MIVLHNKLYKIDGSIEQNSKQAKRYVITVSHGRSGSTLTCTLINNYYSSTPNVNSPEAEGRIGY